MDAVSGAEKVGAASWAARVVELVNAVRAEHGLRPLAVSATLTGIAQAHSEQMALVSKMGHEGVGDGTMSERVRASGIKASRFAENVAYNSASIASPERVMDRWMASEGHRRNILNPAMTQIGVGVEANSQGTYYWTQNFAG